MTDLQITVACIILAVGVVAAGLFSWGISGLFSTGKKSVAEPADAEDYAAALTRKNLAAKRGHKGD